MPWGISAARRTGNHSSMIQWGIGVPCSNPVVPGLDGAGGHRSSLLSGNVPWVEAALLELGRNGGDTLWLLGSGAHRAEAGLAGLQGQAADRRWLPGSGVS